jgi:hypothetical protein
MKREYGPSEGAEMLRGLVEAAKEMRRNELVLTNRDAQMLDEMGVEAPKKCADFKCDFCKVPCRSDIAFYILRDGRICCEQCAMMPGLVN